MTLRIHWPEGEKREYPFADQPLDVYEGEIEIKIEVTIEGEVPATVDLQLAFQACTQQACDLPATRTLRIELNTSP